MVGGRRFHNSPPRYRDQARRFAEADLVRLHADVVEADGALKQGGRGDAVLAALVTRIASASEPGRPPGSRMRARARGA
jgi:hypothetical protein